MCTEEKEPAEKERDGGGDSREDRTDGVRSPPELVPRRKFKSTRTE